MYLKNYMWTSAKPTWDQSVLNGLIEWLHGIGATQVYTNVGVLYFAYPNHGERIGGHITFNDCLVVRIEICGVAHPRECLEMRYDLSDPKVFDAMEKHLKKNVQLNRKRIEEKFYVSRNQSNRRHPPL